MDRQGLAYYTWAVRKRNHNFFSDNILGIRAYNTLIDTYNVILYMIRVVCTVRETRRGHVKCHNNSVLINILLVFYILTKQLCDGPLLIEHVMGDFWISAVSVG